jgi:uncharacterized phage protein (TIGR01671 family)
MWVSDRELKYRAYDTKKKEWLFGYKYPNLGGFSLVSEVTLMGDLKDIPLMDWNHIVVTEYIGLKDKNGNEIYNGDVIKDGEYVMVVRWNKYAASFVLERNGWSFRHYFGEAIDNTNCEVIGNVFDNPELLVVDK